MRIIYIMSVVVLCASMCKATYAQDVDSLRTLSINEVTVTASFARQRQNLLNPTSIQVVDKQLLTTKFTGNLMETLSNVAGVQSMTIGSGFAKPMIRGMGFNRVAVIDGGLKQEGQQWGADHGLEIDAFGVGEVVIHKGASSLLYGSDAMGGALEIVPTIPPAEEQFFGEVSLLGRSVNDLLGGSLMLGLKRGGWLTEARYSEQQFADLKVPTDEILYLTQLIPIDNNRLSNTAGIERGGSISTQYHAGRYSFRLAASDSYQKMGFFAAAHGIPSAEAAKSDGDTRDIDLPYSYVNHFKVSLQQKYYWDKVWLDWIIGYQNNHREEWSSFHTHFEGQTPPEINPDKELAFMLDTYSSNVKVKFPHSNTVQSDLVVSGEIQHNDIAGYGFLLPKYNRNTLGIGWITTYTPNDRFSFVAGIRYDLGHITTEEFYDPYTEEYLLGLGISQDKAKSEAIRSAGIDRGFGNYSASVGVAWNVNTSNNLKLNIGRCFRLPGANELAANGVHHGSFRHEKGDPTLDSEQGWQADIDYSYSSKLLHLNISPFIGYYSNYIYLQPTGEWSMLPDAGQIYLYTGTEALVAGVEISANLSLPCNFNASVRGEWLYNQNLEQNLPLSFSPPATLSTQVGWDGKYIQPYAELKLIAAQNRISQGEEPTPGAQLISVGVNIPMPFISQGATATISVENLFNEKYYNHISFYRKLEIPEAGRNIQISIKIPFKKLLK